MNGANIIPLPSPEMCGCMTRKARNIPTLPGMQVKTDPVLSPDNQTVYFLSERDGGSFNVYSFPLNAPQSVNPVTSFKTHPVRFLSMGSNGTLCYTYDGEIYTQQGNAARKK